MNPLVTDRLTNCKTLPSLPGIALQIVELCRQEDGELSELGAVMSRDPALVSEVFKVLNSAFYSLNHDVKTISHAVALLGTNSVRALALSFSLLRGLRESDVHHELPRFWRRSLISAVAARELGNWANLPDGEELFVAGLLQDIGMLALTQALPQTYGNLVTQSAGDHDYLVELEYRELGGDHAEAGGWLARQWRLPEIYRICMCGSHNIGDASTSVEGTDSVKVVAISGLLADVWVGKDREIAVRKVHEKAGKLLDLKEPEIEQILTRIADSIPEISDLFRIPLDDAETIRDILEQARNALTKVSKKMVQDAHLANLKTEQMASENQELKQLTKQDALTGLRIPVKPATESGANRPGRSEATPEVDNHLRSGRFESIHRSLLG